MIDIFSEEIRRNPYPLYEKLRATAPVFEPPQSGVWMLSDYDSVRRALNDHDAFSSAAAPPGSSPARWLIFSDAPRHTRQRALITKAFTSRAVANLEPRIRLLVDDLLDQRIAHGTMDLVTDFSVPLPLMVIAELLGLPSVEWPTFRRWSDAIIGLIYTVSDRAKAHQAGLDYIAASDEMRHYLGELLPQRRAEPQDDLLTKLVEAEVDGERLSEDEILGFFQLLLLAGHETTTNLLNNAIISLLDHPDQLERLKQSPDLAPSAVEEVLRYRSPVQAAFRVSKRDIELQGQTIPAGSLTLALIGAANRDPAHFAEPNRFDIGRNPNPHIAFGHGVHFCVGAPLARLEARIALPVLLERLPGLALASDEPWEPRGAFHVHGPTKLPIRFEPGTPTTDA